MESLLSVLEHLPPLLVYVVAAAIVTTETALIFGLLLPGEATLLLVGFLSYLGTLRLGPTLVVMVLAAFAGDAVAFRSGRRYGPRVRASRLGQRVGDHRWLRADTMLERLGGRGVAGARWVAFVRTLAPRLAGSAGMSYREFAPWNFIGVASWVGASVLIGYLAGESYERVSELLGRATGAVLVLLLALVAIVLIGRWLGRNPDPVRALAARAGRLPPLRWVVQRYGLLIFLLSMQIGPGWTLLINLITGLVALFAIGFALAWLVGAVVRHSGLSIVDTAIADWFARQRSPDVDRVAELGLSAVRASVLIVLVGVVAVVVAWRAQVWRRDLIGVIGSAGAFLPLVVLAAVADLTGSSTSGSSLPGSVLPTQNAVAAASLCTLAWLLARRARWPRAVAAWTSAAIGIVLISGARLYLGLNNTSETVTSVLLGALWTAVFMIAWATRDRPGRPAGADRHARPEEVAQSGGGGGSGEGLRSGEGFRSGEGVRSGADHRSGESVRSEDAAGAAGPPPATGAAGPAGSAGG